MKSPASWAQLRALGCATLMMIAAPIVASGCRTPAGDDSDVKIVGGSETSDDPAVVAIYVEIMARGARFMCTGTLIAPDKVLTAAHCLEQPRLGFAHVFRVYSATDLRDATKRPRPVTGAKAYPHPEFKYQDPKAGHDIGILTLREPMPASPVAIRRLPLGSDDIGKKLRVVGYGKSHGTLGIGEEIKRTTTVKLNAVSDKKIEVGGFFRNVCRGDSGGPVLMDVDGVETVIGVNSYGDGSCRSSSVATRVDAFVESFLDPILQGQVADGPQ